ncbi:helix-turn-helix transcriptional regulator [Halorientalis brevis]|uniref:Helix-turn-helix transcriptional regulator n=1 Tax=Halorientalis brevis TaxID=1126241 RepID=A0ABD6CEE6_9EURY|nr:helix-turn-helix transcriptional regulator [Halorientalis brevis]
MTRPPAEYHQLRGFQRDCLLAIARLETSDNAPYGLAIKRECQSIRDEEVTHTKLYPNLDELAAQQLITKQELDARTNTYELTDAGRSLLTTHAQTLDTLLSQEATA